MSEEIEPREWRRYECISIVYVGTGDFTDAIGAHIWLRADLKREEREERIFKKVMESFDYE